MRKRHTCWHCYREVELVGIIWNRWKRNVPDPGLMRNLNRHRSGRYGRSLSWRVCGIYLGHASADRLHTRRYQLLHGPTRHAIRATFTSQARVSFRLCHVYLRWTFKNSNIAIA